LGSGLEKQENIIPHVSFQDLTPYL